ncbi:MAG: hypothetical protein QW203_07750 [Thermoplasmatales archaeon]
MKFLQLPDVNPLSLPVGYTYHYPYFKNNTNAYIVITNVTFPLFDLLGANITSLPYFMSINLGIFDPNGNRASEILKRNIEILQAPGSITVWNGTSMETEPAQFPVIDDSTVLLLPAILPPGYSVLLDAHNGTPGSFGITLAGYGFILESEEELIKVIRK